jgi:hypothetical protein
MIKSTGQFDKYFYLLMSLLIAAFVICGFPQRRKPGCEADRPRPEVDA